MSRRRWAIKVTNELGNEVEINLHPISLLRLVAEVIDDATHAYCKWRGHVDDGKDHHCLHCGTSLPDTSQYGSSWLPDAIRTIRRRAA